MYFIGFTIEIYHDAYPYKRHIKKYRIPFNSLPDENISFQFPFTYIHMMYVFMYVSIDVCMYV
jgi:hypothetical protein